MNDKSIKISVIIAIYGVERFLPQCIDSVLNQSYSNIEIILVDDGSIDNCPAICDDYAGKDSRIIVVHKPNGGLISARKAGAQASSGDYICHLDGDDYIGNRYIENYAKVITEYSPDIICSGETRVFPDHQVLNPMLEREGLFNRDQIETEIIPSLLERADGHYFNHSTVQKCTKRWLALESIMTVDDAISMAEDHACQSVAIMRADSLYVTKDCLYYYRLNYSSMTKAPKPLPWSYPRNLAAHFTAHLDLDAYDLREQFNRAICHTLFNTAVSQFNKNDTYSIICADIDKNLAEYTDIIRDTHFSGFRRKLMVKALKHRWYRAMKAYVDMRNDNSSLFKVLRK